MKKILLLLCLTSLPGVVRAAAPAPAAAPAIKLARESAFTGANSRNPF